MACALVATIIVRSRVFPPKRYQQRGEGGCRLVPNAVEEDTDVDNDKNHVQEQLMATTETNVAVHRAAADVGMLGILAIAAQAARDQDSSGGGAAEVVASMHSRSA